MIDSDLSTVLKAPTVAASAYQCLELFQTCLLRADAIHPQELSMVEDQLARFSSWAASIGVFAPGSASMDHRLRYSSEVRDVVTGLLESLNYHVRIYSNSLAIAAASVAVDARSVSDKGLEARLLDIAAEITRLNKISNTIRRASKEAQLLKASDFQIKDDEGRNFESLLLGHFEHYIVDRFPQASDTIRSRLVRSMLLRRKQIMYRRYREGNTYSQFKGTVSPASIKVLGAKSTAEPLAPDMSHQQEEKRPASKLGASKVQSATTLVAENYKMTSRAPSKVSASRTIASGKHQALVYPPAPGFAAKRAYEQFKSQQAEEAARTNNESSLQDILASHLQTIGEITCPYCLNALPAADVFDTRKWQNHVKGDLEPYICLFEDCDQPDVLYTHSEEWLGHLHQHRKVWYCSLRCEIGPFSELDKYMEHMRQVHNTNLNDRQLRAIANRNSRRTVTLFSSCPLCGEEESEAESRFEDHLAGHLRSLALKSLPSYQDGIPDGAASVDTSINGSQPRSRSTIKDIFEETVGPFQSIRYLAVEERSESPLSRAVELSFVGGVFRPLLKDENGWPVGTIEYISKVEPADLQKDPILQSICEQQGCRDKGIHDPPDDLEKMALHHSETNQPKFSVKQPSKQGEVDSATTPTINAQSIAAGSAMDNQVLDKASGSPSYDGVDSEIQPVDQRDQTANFEGNATQEGFNDMEDHGGATTTDRATQSPDEPTASSASLKRDQPPHKTKVRVTIDSPLMVNAHQSTPNYYTIPQREEKFAADHLVSDNSTQRFDPRAPSSMGSLGSRENISPYYSQAEPADESARNTLRRRPGQEKSANTHETMPLPEHIPQRPKSAALQQTRPRRPSVVYEDVDITPARRRNQRQSTYTSNIQRAGPKYEAQHTEFKIRDTQVYEDAVTDRRGGRTAWSSLVVVLGRTINARYWYDGKSLNNAKEDAAECAVTWLNTNSIASIATSSSGLSGSLRPGDYKETMLYAPDSESEDALPVPKPPGEDSFLSTHSIGDDVDMDPSTRTTRYPRVDRRHMANVNTAGYRVEYSGRFQPGQMFKILWPEPQGSMRDVSESSSGRTTAKGHYGNQIHVGVRQFIIISRHQGHCNCVPIITCGRRGTNKDGVQSARHGIVYEYGTIYSKLDGERELGYRPVRVETTADGETLPNEARIDYSKVVTVELNLKVFFVGHVYEDDWNIVEDAVNDCRNKKMRPSSAGIRRFRHTRISEDDFGRG